MVYPVISLFQRRVAVGAAFLAPIALVVLLNHRADRAGDASPAPPLHLTNIPADAGNTILHLRPTLDPDLLKNRADIHFRSGPDPGGVPHGMNSRGAVCFAYDGEGLRAL